MCVLYMEDVTAVSLVYVNTKNFEGSGGMGVQKFPKFFTLVRQFFVALKITRNFEKPKIEKKGPKFFFACAGQ